MHEELPLFVFMPFMVARPEPDDVQGTCECCDAVLHAGKYAKATDILCHALRQLSRPNLRRTSFRPVGRVATAEA